MRKLLKRAGALAIVGLGSTLVPLLAATPASAAPGAQPAPSVTPNPVPTAASNFALSNGTCDGTGGDGWRVQTFIVNTGVDVGTLVFDQGPFSDRVGSDRDNSDNTIASPLWKDNAPGTGYEPAAAPAGLINPTDLSSFDFSNAGWVLTDGSYQIGYVCLDPLSNVSQWWAQTVTVDTTPGGGSNFLAVGLRAPAPSIVTVAPGNGQAVIDFTGTGADNWTAQVSTVSGDFSPGNLVGSSTTATADTQNITVTGLMNGQTYYVRVVANKAGFAPVPSAQATATPVADLFGPTGVSVSVSAVAGPDSAVVSWTPPTGNSPPTDPTNYTVALTGPVASTQTVAFGTNTATFPGLTQGAYTVTVTANYPGGVARPAPAVSFVVNPDGSLFQNIDVTRPVGALVLTQVCATNAAFGEDVFPTGTPAGFPDGMPAVAAASPSVVGAPSTGGTDPTTLKDGVVLDPRADEYPYPTDVNGVSNPTYPTHCGLNLGPAEFVTRGAGAGQFFAATGVLNQVTIVDTRDSSPTGATGPDWTVTGQASQFLSETDANDFFSAKQLGWTPRVTSFTTPFPDGNGGTYTPDPQRGDNVDPNSTVANTSALEIARTMASAENGLGTTVLDARVRVLIPVTADAGRYESQLTITTI